MPFTNKEISRIAMKPSAIDANCEISDFCKTENVIVISNQNDAAWSNLKSVRNAIKSGFMK